MTDFDFSIPTEEQSTTSADPGCILLFYNILRQALEDLADEKTRLDAEIWIFSSREDGSSFIAICSIFGLNPWAVRRIVIKWLAENQDVKKLFAIVEAAESKERWNNYQRIRRLGS